MATSPNFSWPEPDNTDLVKNGALAIRTAVDAIDSSMADLKGGTTGQVLTKASGTDMDFSWAASSSSPTSYGYAAGKNAIINGDFRINQRAFTSNTASGSFNFDRFYQIQGGSGTLTVTPQTFTVGTAPVAGYEAINFVRCVTASGSSTNTYALFEQKIEDVRTFANQTVTVSFWAKTTSGTPKLSFEIEQACGSGGSGSFFTASSSTATLSTSWTRYSFTIAVPSLSGKTIGTSSYLACGFWLSGGSDFNTRANSIGIQNATFDIWGLQIEAGSTATSFQTATGTIQGELAACQRYYYASNAGICTAGIAPSTAYIYGRLVHPVPMRTTPSGSISPTGTTFTVTDDYSSAASSTSVTGFGNDSWITSTSARVSLSGFTGLTGGRFYSVDGRSAGQIMFSAEL